MNLFYGNFFSKTGESATTDAYVLFDTLRFCDSDYNPGNPNGVNDYSASIEVVSRSNGIYQTVAEVPSVVDLINSNGGRVDLGKLYLPGDSNPLIVDDANLRVTLTAQSKLESMVHEMTVGFNPLKSGNYLGVSDLLTITYGEEGASSARDDSTDQAIGWGNDKYAATSNGEYGIISRSEPFGDGDALLTKDSRASNDPLSILIEAHSNSLLENPEGLASGEPWNEGGTLEFTIPDNDPFFDDFVFTQVDTGSFNPVEGMPSITLQEIDLLDGVDDGFGQLAFGRMGFDTFPGFETVFQIGPYSCFVITPPFGEAWDTYNNSFILENGAYAISHWTDTPSVESAISVLSSQMQTVPEPSTLGLLAGLGLMGAVGYIRRRRKVMAAIMRPAK